MDSYINKVVHSTSTTMQCPSEVLRSTRPSAALSNVVHESNQYNTHKEFTHIQPLVNFGKL